MQVTIEEVNSVKKILHIEVPEETVVSELDNAYNQLKKTAKVNGFRPGKTPRSVLERQFKKDVHSDVVNTLIQNSLVEVIREKDISFIGEPMIEPPELDPKSVYKYSATIETKPVLGAIDFSGLTLEKTQYKISDEEVNTQLEMMRKNLASRVDIKDQRPVEENDFLMMDHVGQVNGESFEATPEVVNGPYKVGSALFSRDFDDQLIGLNPGDSKTFEIDYDDSYINSGLAGNKVSFTVKVNAIQEEVLPELDDELAKRIGAYETLDSLKAEIVNNLEQGT